MKWSKRPTSLMGCLVILVTLAAACNKNGVAPVASGTAGADAYPPAMPPPSASNLATIEAYPAQNYPTPTIETTPEPTAAYRNEAGWSVYTNTVAGFSIAYPDIGMYASSTNDRGLTLVFDVKGATAWQGMSIVVEGNPDHLTPQEFADVTDRQSQSQESWVLVGQTLVDGHEAIDVRYHWDCGDFVRLVPHGPWMVVVSLARGDCMHGSDPRPESQELFDQIMATFRFEAAGDAK